MRRSVSLNPTPVYGNVQQADCRIIDQRQYCELFPQPLPGLLQCSKERLQAAIDA
jgi:hypothetical protein